MIMTLLITVGKVTAGLFVVAVVGACLLCWSMQGPPHMCKRHGWQWDGICWDCDDDHDTRAENRGAKGRKMQ